MPEGTPKGQTAYETVTGAAPSEAMLRAEAAVDRLGERVGHFVSTAGHNLMRFTARAREEAEDMWAEAQSIRNGQTADEDLEGAGEADAHYEDGSTELDEKLAG